MIRRLITDWSYGLRTNAPKMLERMYYHMTGRRICVYWRVSPTVRLYHDLARAQRNAAAIVQWRRRR